jgi:predicted RNA-binding Zn-ribbon protein involved in translation (DUF1610 family)
MRDQETFELDCAACARSVEIECTTTPHRCPHCGEFLQIEWRTAGNRPSETRDDQNTH